MSFGYGIRLGVARSLWSPGRLGSSLKALILADTLTATNGDLIAAVGGTIAGASVTAAGAGRPVYRPTGVNSRPSLEFNGTAAFMTFAGLTASSTEWLYAFVLTPLAPPAANRFLLDASTDRPIVALGAATAGNRMAYYDGSGFYRDSGAAATAVAQVLVYDCRVSPGLRVFRDGVQVGSTATHSGNVQSFAGTANLGADAFGASRFAGQLAAAAICTAPTDENRNALTRWLGARYGLPVA